MPKCVYCGKMYDTHKGLTYIKIDGSVNYLCSSKCRKNMKMKRRKVRWISKKKKEVTEVKKETPKVEVKKEVVKKEVSKKE
jgi:large subunit ribosomal protein L24e